MEDLEAAPGSPTLQNGEEPQAINDPGDPLGPEIEEEHRPDAPLDSPAADVDTFEDEEAPETVAKMNEAADGDQDDMADGAFPDEEESELEELDEKEFEDFDPSALNIPEKPVQVDESNVGLLGVHKRKRTEEEERERKKKKKEGRREKPKRSKKKQDGDDEFEGGEEIEGKRTRKSKVAPDGRPVKQLRRARTPPEDDENMTPEERRRRALDRKMDEALKSHRTGMRRGRRAGVDLEAAADAEIESMRQRMAKACELDAEARAKGAVATHKLSILPEVVELMNRNTIQAQMVDPDINLLEAVRFMLEPADHDAALPNYQIQRELFGILSRLNIGKEALIASGIGKVILFYTKSIQPQPEIKRMAEKLVGAWMRVVLNKGDNKRGKATQTKTYDPVLMSSAAASQKSGGGEATLSLAERSRLAAEKRRKALEQPIPGNRARVEGGLATYTITPVNNLSNAIGSQRRMGAGGDEMFKRIAARGALKASASGGKR